ncbi:putative ubiquinol--cytochrome-c reductase [Hypoxylon crocopeplum]|nr:putative ubiquinol--cytochrome-c reductase [Hypoxylon crocopeplum]
MASSYPSLAPFIFKRPWLRNLLTPVASWYTNAAGYRKLGLRSDDLIVEENENVIKALKRLPPKEAYDRVYRLRRAFQCSTTHRLLPREEWTKQEEDVPYLQPLINQVLAEAKEKQALDSMTIIRSH